MRMGSASGLHGLRAQYTRSVYAHAVYCKFSSAPAIVHSFASELRRAMEQLSEWHAARGIMGSGMPCARVARCRPRYVGET
jgi:hypothetical protein